VIVMKFGGTSVESAEAMERVAGIVCARLPQHPVVVVSAMGKTTNQLLFIGSAAVAGERELALGKLGELREFHRCQSAGLDVTAEVEAHFEELAELVKGLAVVGELTPRGTDALASFGERISSVIIAAFFRRYGMRASHLDARRLIVTDGRHTQAAPLLGETYARLAAAIPPLAHEQVVVLGGFIGATEGGIPTTLGRGGSDYTASIAGAGIGAEEIQIWTDVDGMLTCDPTILKGGFRVKTCSFAEAAELAYFGAKVLHPATVLPAIEKNIPVRILNSRRPESIGTLIVAAAPPCANAVRSIACKRNITVVNIVSTRMLMAHGFLRRIFEIFDRFETAVDMLATSEVSVSLTIDNTRALDAIRAGVEEFAEVSVERDQAIVCLVGDNIRETPGVASRVFDALQQVNVRMISQGASLLNISVVLAAGDLPRAVESLHREFFSNPDPAGFE
jgi:aspartate kinase